MKPLVIYHGNCIDGFTAAWAIWKKHPDWEFFAGKYGDAPPDVTGRDVYMVDFSYKLPVILKMIDSAKTITIIDHHKTAQADLAGLEEQTNGQVIVMFDMEKSGAHLTWEYFHPSKVVPQIVKYVEDRDLWRFTFPETEAINAYIFSKEYDFHVWDDMARCLDDGGDLIADMGRAIAAKHHKDIKELSVNSYRAKICGYDVPVINVPYTLASDMCHLLGKNEPFAASYYFDGKRNKIVVSLRSEENGVDVSEIAKSFGGGGHKHAAGFELVNFGMNFGG